MSLDAKIERMIKFMEEDTKQRLDVIIKKSKEQADLISQQLSITETKKAEAEIERELKEAKQELQVKESGQLNSSRLEVLRVRDQIIQQCLDKCKEQMKQIKNYPEVMKKLVMQGASQLVSNEIVVQICGGDEALFATMQKDLERQGIKSSLHEKKLNKEDHIGGLNIYSSDRKILIENTFTKRLMLSYKKMSPEVSARLFEDHSSLW
ncbi:Vacuolar_ATP synthase subunit E [Hexamita inflata]|uniref:Vacuolar ATP synthase subunit E n=1 Tax=Hexamita inflata TaxID=28002 RepID=A0AA86Q2K8_9EUKA|nr:Vacuolar ATP synthase subunit E [Hexamita inflata]